MDKSVVCASTMLSQPFNFHFVIATNFTVTNDFAIIHCEYLNPQKIQKVFFYFFNIVNYWFPNQLYSSHNFATEVSLSSFQSNSAFCFKDIIMCFLLAILTALEEHTALWHFENFLTNYETNQQE